MRKFNSKSTINGIKSGLRKKEVGGMQNDSLTFSASLPGALVTAVNSQTSLRVCQKRAF